MKIHVLTYSYRGFIYSYFKNADGFIRHEFMEVRNPDALRKMGVRQPEPLNEPAWKLYVDSILGLTRP